MKEEESEGSSKRRKEVFQAADEGATWATGPRISSLGQRAGIVGALGKDETELSVVQ